jgi:CRP-like cAMP-binding protein
LPLSNLLVRICGCQHGGVGIRAVFVNAKEQRTLTTGEQIFAEGDLGKEMFGVISGAVELSHGGRLVGRVEPGDTFGEMAIISDAPRSLTASAAEESVIASIDSKMFLYLVHETPMFAIQVMRSLADRIRQLDDLH